MLKPSTIIACTLLAALPLSACNKGRHTPQAPVYPTAQSTSPLSTQADPRAAKRFDEALAHSGLSDERRAALMSELEKQAPQYGFKLSADKELLQSKGESGTQGLQVQKILLEASNLKSSTDAAGQIKTYLEQIKMQVDQAAQEAEKQAKGLARIDQGEIIEGMVTADNPAGEWRSLGETREGEKHFLVQHDDQYYKVLRIDSDKKTLQYQEFKDGQVERDTTLPYEYVADKGELTTRSAGGGPGDSFVVMALPNYPDRIFLRPMYDTVFAYTVYRRVGTSGTGQIAPVAVQPGKGGK
jgi:hypothetical protein